MPEGPKLQFQPLDEPLHIVLVHPEIPPNTGAVARTCAATHSVLHLVEPLGFKVDERSVRRAGLDYWPHVRLKVHTSWEAFGHEAAPSHLRFFTAHAPTSYVDAPYRPGDFLVFGCESQGLPEELYQNVDDAYAIPTSGRVRSLNLSNAVALVTYHALHAIGAFNHTLYG